MTILLFPIRHILSTAVKVKRGLAAETMLRLRETYPELRLILVLPCKEQTRCWQAEDIKKYEDIRQRAGKTVYTSEVYATGCMHKRNRHLVDRSSVCVCYQTRPRRRDGIHSQLRESSWACHYQHGLRKRIHSKSCPQILLYTRRMQHETFSNIHPTQNTAVLLDGANAVFCKRLD